HISPQTPQSCIRIPHQSRIRLPHRLEILHQRQRVRVLDHDVIDIDRQELESRFLQQPAHIPHIREGGYMGSYAAAAIEVRELQAGAEFEEGVTAEYRGEERGVWFQNRGDLREQGGEVVDPVEGEGGKYCVEAVGRERERLGLWVWWEDCARVRWKDGVERKIGVAVEKGGGPVCGGELGETGMQ
ncbi:MAG: hypothetical protein Q9210_007165, partial [Variospora velana]